MFLVARILLLFFLKKKAEAKQHVWIHVRAHFESRNKFPRTSARATKTDSLRAQEEKKKNATFTYAGALGTEEHEKRRR